MKKADIKVGRCYQAKVSGKLTTVRVDAIHDRCEPRFDGRWELRYDVTNLTTGRKTTFRSAAKFRWEVKPEKTGGSCGSVAVRQLASAINSKSLPVASILPRSAAIEYRDSQVVGGVETNTTFGDLELGEASELTAPEIAAAKSQEDEQRADFPVVANAAPTTRRAATTSAQATSNPRPIPPEADGLKDNQLRSFLDVTRLLEAKQRIIKLCGFAGTGKTFLLARIAAWAKRTGREVIVAAPTHKAASVIKEKLGDSSIEVRTIHSLLGLQLAPDFENDTGGRILQAGSKSKPPAGLVICDEASMVGSVLKEHIDRAVGVTWLFVGDLAQLPPVGENISELLDEPDAELVDVLRQAEGSEILELATRIRQGDMSMAFAPGKDVAQVTDAEELFQAALARFQSPEYQTSASHARMLVFRNARREALNTRMRALLVDSPNPYTAGEWLVMYAQFSPEKSRLNVLSEEAKGHVKGDYGYGKAWRAFFEYKESLPVNENGVMGVTQLHMSEEVRIRDVGIGTVKVAETVFDVWLLEVEARDGEVYELPVLTEADRETCKQFKDDIVAAAQEKRVERDAHPEKSSEWARLDKLRKGYWSAYFTLEETFAQVDYAYAMTVHKSQGSTFDHAFIDVPDLMTSGGMQQRILYTAATRPAKSLTFYN